MKDWIRYFLGKMSDEEKIQHLMKKSLKPMIRSGLWSSESGLESINIWIRKDRDYENSNFVVKLENIVKHRIIDITDDDIR